MREYTASEMEEMFMRFYRGFGDRVTVVPRETDGKIEFIVTFRLSPLDVNGVDLAIEGRGKCLMDAWGSAAWKTRQALLSDGQKTE